ncbi:Sialic acid TRAP transporter permease protein SiaT [Roseivivax jejudonensis]|uniref:Sialic acid TRAP transporter permease protein SiaT n=1 Tax=Roseivivax jejudonensis TaxID=1529041 RepID=A0A1X6ZWC3_9RHOB|nr:TRAP transporter fused permease subunit [Roseivivax jejudonensis]SLN63729.1 Sialic acid TRAP transporter permease protein SiaT [Roseivivax jejudonensis]
MTPSDTDNAAEARPGLRPAADVLAVAMVGIAVAWAAGLHRMLRLSIYTEQFLAAVLGLAMAYVFLTQPLRSLPPALGRVVDVALAAIALAGGAWLALYYPDLSLAAAIDPGDALRVSVAVLVTLLLALYRVAGWPLTIVVVVFGAYGIWGAALPGQFQALPISPERLASQLALDTGGILGTPLAIAATVVVVFVAFGRLLDHLGGAAFFTDLAAAVMGGFRGGAAKISVAASALFGSISGSAVSNVATTGVITIPLMRRSGFRAEHAGGIEAVASTGGQLTPPVMGAAAFLMAEFLNIPYSQVVLAALVPAAFYYVALFLQADLTAAREGIAGMPAADRPRAGAVLRRGWIFVVPFVALVWALFSLNYQPATAGLVACAILLGVSLVLPEGRRGLRPDRLLGAIASGGPSFAQIVVITAAAGIVIGVLNETGLSFGLTSYLVTFARDEALGLLVLAAAVSIVLGMGMPTIAVYVLLASLVAPALTRLGIEPVAAHLFVLYFGMMSMISPPVAIAAFAAATLSGAGPMRTALAALRFGWPAFVLPFAFAYNPALLLAGGAGQTALSILLTLCGIVGVTVALAGWVRGPLPPALRGVAAALGLALILWPVIL